MSWRGASQNKPSEEGVRLSRTGDLNLTTWTEETKNPRQSLQTDGVTFFGESQQPALKVCGLERWSLFLVRMNN